MRGLSVNGVQTCALPISFSRMAECTARLVDIGKPEIHGHISEKWELTLSLEAPHRLFTLTRRVAVRQRREGVEAVRLQSRSQEIGRASCRERVCTGRHAWFVCEWSSDVCSSDLLLSDGRVHGSSC